MEQEDIFHHWEAQSQGVSAPRVPFCGFWGDPGLFSPLTAGGKDGKLSPHGGAAGQLDGQGMTCPGGRNSCKQSYMQLGVCGMEMETLTPGGHVGTTFRPGRPF